MRASVCEMVKLKTGCVAFCVWISKGLIRSERLKRRLFALTTRLADPPTYFDAPSSSVQHREVTKATFRMESRFGSEGLRGKKRQRKIVVVALTTRRLPAFFERCTAERRTADAMLRSGEAGKGIECMISIRCSAKVVGKLNREHVVSRRVLWGLVS